MTESRTTLMDCTLTDAQLASCIESQTRYERSLHSGRFACAFDSEMLTVEAFHQHASAGAVLLAARSEYAALLVWADRLQRGHVATVVVDVAERSRYSVLATGAPEPGVQPSRPLQIRT